MKIFNFILVCLLLSCATNTQYVDNTELVVEYDGMVEVRSGGAYID